MLDTNKWCLTHKSHFATIGQKHTHKIPIQSPTNTQLQVPCFNYKQQLRHPSLIYSAQKYDHGSLGPLSSQTQIKPQSRFMWWFSLSSPQRFSDFVQEKHVSSVAEPTRRNILQKKLHAADAKWLISITDELFVVIRASRSECQHIETFRKSHHRINMNNLLQQQAARLFLMAGFFKR